MTTRLVKVAQVAEIPVGGSKLVELERTRVALPAWGSIPLGALAAVLAGLIIGIPCLRLRGTYLALTTLAFPIILLGVIYAIPDITGGELGISGLERLSGSRVTDYYIAVVLMIGSLHHHVENNPIQHRTYFPRHPGR